MNYLKLCYLLAIRAWQAADQETELLLLAAAKQTIPGRIHIGNIGDLPYKEICIIDYLWVRFSSGRFGFSVQQRIYDKVVENTNNSFINCSEQRKFNCQWHIFTDNVGWRKQGKWMYEQDLTFNLKAPVGHLPTFYLDGIWEIFFSHLKAYQSKNYTITLIKIINISCANYISNIARKIWVSISMAEKTKNR